MRVAPGAEPSSSGSILAANFPPGIKMGIRFGGDPAGHVCVYGVTGGSPAEVQGVPLGARLLSVNEKSTVGMSPPDVASMLAAVAQTRRLTFELPPPPPSNFLPCRTLFGLLFCALRNPSGV